MFDFNAKPNKQEKAIIAYLKSKHKKSGLWYSTTVEKIAKDFNTNIETIEKVLRSIKDKLLFDIRLSNNGKVKSYCTIGLFK
ncbi:hypothetical protein [Ligilactobacillus aviarius]|uniref:Helix-turn-helix type 11 domain-containing protein n=1 Tax=Ligilactobacillus aviarius TaxID=1606 RepID=A0A510WQ83_9LACO|nr:hypothetical protein [Ligilactobacillus aviarius]GEK41326.1 hypothetical protein LAV01_01580 [Ligilactobacillus aviarius]